MTARGPLLRAVCCLAVALLHVGACRRAPVAAELKGQRARLVSWNVHECATGVETIIGELRRMDADIVCLQEVIAPSGGPEPHDQARHIAAALGMECYSQGAPLPDGRRQCEVILARGRLTDPQPLDAGTGRPYGVTAVVRWRGRRLRIVCVHLTATYRADWQHIVDTTQYRIGEADDLAARVSAWTEAVLVAGDLNAIPGQPPCEKLRERLPVVPQFGPTFPASQPAVAIDHAFGSNGLVAHEAHVDSSEASDHRPIIVEWSRGD